MPVVLFDPLPPAQPPSPSGPPLRHLQLAEQGSPAAPLFLPSSHSSPKFGSYLPFPHPTGVAPRLIMYGIPIVPSAKVWLPTPEISCAMARAWKPHTPGGG